MEEALFLTRFATKVTLIHRRGEFRASKIMLDRARKHEQIEFLTDTVVDEVLDRQQEGSHRAASAQPEDRRAMGLPDQRHVPGHRPYAECAASSATNSTAMAMAT